MFRCKMSCWMGSMESPAAATARETRRESSDGKPAMTQVTLHPAVVFARNARPSTAQHEGMHHEAHEQCFIASSVKTDVRCEAVDITT